MRLFEIAIAICLLTYIASILSPSREPSPLIELCPILVLVLVAFHVKEEGYRLQMFPAYFLSVACITYQLAPRFADIQNQYLLGVASLGLLAVAVVLSTVFPVFELPAPTGPNAVGTDVRYLVDAARRDPNDPGRERELMIQIWYPTAVPQIGARAPYVDSRITDFLNARFGLVATHSYFQAPVSTAQDRYPVLLYAPSWDGMRTENTHQAEELASHGYIVVGIDHPHSSLATVFPDGRVVRTELLDDDFFSSDAKFNAFATLAEQEIRTRADDVRFVLESLGNLGQQLSGRLNLDEIGIFGFSIGGGVAAQACWADRRLKACINLDGMMAAESWEQGAVAPYLIVAEHDAPSPDEFPNADSTKRRELQADWAQFVQMKKLLARDGGYWVTVQGSKHFNFSDYAFSSPLRRFNYAGAIDPRRAARIVSQFMIAFFDKYLKGVEEPLLDGASQLPAEVRFERTKGGGNG